MECINIDKKSGIFFFWAWTWLQWVDLLHIVVSCQILASTYFEVIDISNTNFQVDAGF